MRIVRATYDAKRGSLLLYRKDGSMFRLDGFNRIKAEDLSEFLGVTMLVKEAA